MFFINKNNKKLKIWWKRRDGVQISIVDIKRAHIDFDSFFLILDYKYLCRVF